MQREEPLHFSKLVVLFCILDRRQPQLLVIRLLVRPPICFRVNSFRNDVHKSSSAIEHFAILVRLMRDDDVFCEKAPARSKNMSDFRVVYDFYDTVNDRTQ